MSLLHECQENFTDELGTIKPFQAKLSVSASAKPCFHHPKPVPYALKPSVEDELNRPERTGVIERVEFSDRAAPI